MKKCIVLVLSVLLVFSLIACVGEKAGANESVVGKYNFIESDIQGVPTTPEGFIELKSGGKLFVDLMGTEGEGTWKLEGEALTLEIDGDPIVAQLKDNKIVLDIGDGVVFHFAK